MCPVHCAMTSKDIYRHTARVLQPHLQWHNRGPKCTVTALLQVMFDASAQLCSLFAACRRLRDAPSDQAVRDALVALCAPAETLEQKLNASFAAQLPRAVNKRRWRLAIDLNLRPDYGHAQNRVEELYRSQAKNGTTHFHAYAMAAKPWFMPFGVSHRKRRNGSSKSTGIVSASRPAIANSARPASKRPPAIPPCGCCLWA
jgi:hypothetical protein